MRELTERDRKILLLAGKMCYEDIINEIEFMEITMDENEKPEYDRERLRKAEAEAWAEFYREQRIKKIRRWTVGLVGLILVLGLVFTYAKPSVAYQKLSSKGFMVENETSMSIFSSNTVLVPDDWSGCYVLAYIPSGYKIESADRSKTVQSIVYTNEAKDYIIFSVYIDNYNLNSDMENCVIEDIQIGDNNGNLMTRMNTGSVEYRAITWKNGDIYFDVTSNALNEEVLVSIAESIMLAD